MTLGLIFFSPSTRFRTDSIAREKTKNAGIRTETEPFVWLIASAGTFQRIHLLQVALLFFIQNQYLAERWIVRIPAKINCGCWLQYYVLYRLSSAVLILYFKLFRKKINLLYSILFGYIWNRRILAFYLLCIHTNMYAINRIFFKFIFFTTLCTFCALNQYLFFFVFCLSSSDSFWRY